MIHGEPTDPKQTTEPTFEERAERQRRNSLEDRQEVAGKLMAEVDTLLGDDVDRTWQSFAAADSFAHSPDQVSRMSHMHARRVPQEDGSVEYSVTMPDATYLGSGQFEFLVRDGEIQAPQTLQRDGSRARMRDASLGELEDFYSLVFQLKNTKREFIPYDPLTEEFEWSNRKEGYEIVKKASLKQRMRKFGRAVVEFWNGEDD